MRTVNILEAFCNNYFKIILLIWVAQLALYTLRICFGFWGPQTRCRTCGALSRGLVGLGAYVLIRNWLVLHRLVILLSLPSTIYSWLCFHFTPLRRFLSSTVLTINQDNHSRFSDWLLAVHWSMELQDRLRSTAVELVLRSYQWVREGDRCQCWWRRFLGFIISSYSCEMSIFEFSQGHHPSAWWPCDLCVDLLSAGDFGERDDE